MHYVLPVSVGIANEAHDEAEVQYPQVRLSSHVQDVIMMMSSG